MAADSSLALHLTRLIMPRGKTSIAANVLTVLESLGIIQERHNGLSQSRANSGNCLQSPDPRISGSQLIELVFHFLQGFADSFKCLQFNMKPTTLQLLHISYFPQWFGM